MNKKGEVIFIIVVFLFVFCCFSVPIIIYAASSDVTPSQDIGVEIDVDNCPQQVSKNIPIALNYIVYIGVYNHP